MNGYNCCQQWLNESHILIAGKTGSGKSVLLDNFLYTITSYDTQCKRAIIIDLKRVQFEKWRKFPHIHEICTEPENVVGCIQNVVNLMEFRYKEMRKHGLVQSHDGDLYLIIDELAEVLTIKGALPLLEKLLRLSRAANIHTILATQNPSRKNLPASIQQNISISIGLKCRTKIESKQIIGIPGCEELPKYGYCIVSDNDGYHLWDVPLTSQEMIEDRYQELIELGYIQPKKKRWFHNKAMR